MSYLKMPFGNTVLAAFLLASYVTAATSTIGDYAEHAAYSLADVAAQMRQFDLAIRSSGQEWYREGMQLSAYCLNGFWWETRKIRWDIKKESTQITREDAEAVFAKAFAKWAKVTPLIFKRLPLYKMGSIYIYFDKEWEKWTTQRNEVSLLNYHSTFSALDVSGIDIVINDNVNWTDEKREDYHNLHFAALHEIGRALGLGDPKIPSSAVSVSRQRFRSKVKDPILHPDDIEGIQSLYGTPDGKPGIVNFVD